MTENLRISYSSLGTAQSCYRKFELQKLYKQPERGFESIAMSAGTAIHVGYQSYLIHRDLDRAIWDLSLAYPHINCWDEYDHRSWEACMATLVSMIEHGNHSEWTVAYIKNHEGETVPAIEVPFEIELRGLKTPEGRGVSYVGFMDAIMERFNGRDYRTLDIKTHRSNTKDRTPNFVFDSQQVPYGIAIEHALGREVNEFTVDYLDCFIDIIQSRVVAHEYAKTRADTTEWIVGTILKVKMLLAQMEMDYFLRADHGCMFYNRPCKFLDICTSRDKDTVQKVLLIDGPPAEEKPWNPWIKCYIDTDDIGVKL